MKLDIQDKFLQRDGRVFLTGMEAIVRLVREKQERDQATGHVNQTYFTGYEGSPLGGLDLKIVAQLEMLNKLGRTVHQFGINEKTAASAVLGSQFAASGGHRCFLVWQGARHDVDSRRGVVGQPQRHWSTRCDGPAIGRRPPLQKLGLAWGQRLGVAQQHGANFLSGQYRRCHSHWAACGCPVAPRRRGNCAQAGDAGVRWREHG